MATKGADEKSTPEAKSHYQKKMAVQAMGIMNVSEGKELALAFQGKENMNQDPQTIKEIMKWDMWSPWASYYELYSTHPLTAKRINAIGTHALSLGQEPWVIFDSEKPESYWDDFIIDLFVVFLPEILGIGFVATKFILVSYGTENINWFDLVIPLIFGFSAGGIIKTMQMYPGGNFSNYSIVSLLKKINVSQVRSYPVKITGRIIGRGDAGNIFSEDMIIRDKTGIIFLDHEPFGFNLFFALFRIDRFRGVDVEVEGWYRRSPKPYVEVKRIYSRSDSSRSYTYYYQLLAWIAFSVIAFLSWNYIFLPVLRTP
ncbi:MAG: hypothetical protein HY072_09505 [Deltaproteobacteria bacterium]|nr:hypothetical protein [Deltaproteobacteria bacterium]